MSRDRYRRSRDYNEPEGDTNLAFAQANQLLDAHILEVKLLKAYPSRGKEEDMSFSKGSPKFPCVCLRKT